MSENEGLDQLAGLIAASDQLVEAMRGVSKVTAVFYNELISRGVPEDNAVALTACHLQEYWKFQAIMSVNEADNE